MSTSCEGYAGVVRLNGRVSDPNNQRIMVGARTGRDQIAAAMSEAIRMGDVKGVLAALSWLCCAPPARKTIRALTVADRSGPKWPLSSL
jgi:hypothetical protein